MLFHCFAETTLSVLAFSKSIFNNITVKITEIEKGLETTKNCCWEMAVKWSDI